MWVVEQTDEFEAWFKTAADEAMQDDVLAGIELLEEYGPTLGRPHVDTLSGSKHRNMKELRVQSNGRPVRIAFAFDPERKAILLIGGDKSGVKRFYEWLIPQADRLFDAHLKALVETREDG
jgi:hypothetical protein